jgi:NAD(P)-dependent dehydrogenase (short-subunit alcohol dehydrogenase family)
MKHSILITGASSGIGRSIAVFLAQTGHQVFAGVRKQEDGAKLKAEESSITPVIIDVTKPDTIKTCFEEIGKLRLSDRPFSLVNNAGIALAGPVEALKVSELRRQFEVNFFGLVEATQVFLPMIRETRGRIFNVSSIGGRVSSPFLSAYSASKFAVEALSDSLRQELAPFGVHVVLIEPGPIQTEIWAKGLENKAAIEDSCHADRFPLYEKRLRRFEKIVESVASNSIPAVNVARKVANALEAKTPPIRIVIAPVQSRLQLHAGEWLPSRFLDRVVSKVLKA